MIADLIFLDVETTGNREQDRLCQIAYKTHQQTFDEFTSELYKPPIEVSVEAMAVHHITNDELQDKLVFANSSTFDLLKDLFENQQKILVAHNVAFDKEMLLREGISVNRTIDTLRLVRHQDPYLKIGRHNLQYLRYYLDLTRDYPKKIDPHDAKSDVILLQLLFERLFQGIQKKFNLNSESETLDKMMELSQAPAFIGKMMFGKYQGLSVMDVARQDPAYLVWLREQKSQNPVDEMDWLHTIEVALYHAKNNP